MAITNFIPKVWSARLKEQLHKQLVFGALCNRNWEGDIAEYGDTVHINQVNDITVKAYVPGADIDAPEQLSGTDTVLTIDHGAYYNFFLSDVDAAQARADVMDAAMRVAAQRLAEDTESYILTRIRAEGTAKTGSLADGAYKLIVAVKTAMDAAFVPRAGRCLVLPATVEAELLLDDRFVTGNGSLSADALENGCIARAAGFDIYISPDLTGEMIALTRDSVTFAQQITRVEAYRREKGFDDGVKGLSLCGCKVVQPESCFVYTLS